MLRQEIARLGRVTTHFKHTGHVRFPVDGYLLKEFQHFLPLFKLGVTINEYVCVMQGVPVGIMQSFHVNT